MSRLASSQTTVASRLWCRLYYLSPAAFNRPADGEAAAEASAEFRRRREFTRNSVLGLSTPLNHQSALAVSADERRR
ncbi:hypothetical protein LP52_18260, partial [Streptomonospora alba]